MNVVEALVPVFALIAVGAALHRAHFIDETSWRAIERVTYYVLFPAFLFNAIAVADFTGEPVGRIALILVGAIAVMTLLVYAIQSVLKFDGPAFTSVFQGALRFNSYVALAAIASMLGPQGIAVSAIAVAVMVPLLNTLCVTVLMHHASDDEATIAMFAKQFVQNPLIMSCLAAIAVQLLGIPIPKVLVTTVGMAGKAALPLGLLAVGASLDLADARARPLPVLVSITLRLLVMPLLVLAGTLLVGVGGTAKAAALICGAVPGASSSFILARQLGGDAPLMANITTAQTLVAMVTMPLILWVFA
ncbi:MAG: AEC family transporter [Alphaproteobacteria bacterium]|nr:AEC family transporter [Alphaproteobacteria bacterium]